ncbi:hypothetical protein [Paludisphaera rhizosphaerae]|uniref:hypothetical protein n=1 Tax=Paludisphaera rhizosphaerae TaxID=2711216 RepID=UPI0013EC6DA4|nr:hypothetical protein [Paludisphaera rhizosphaerae]
MSRIKALIGVVLLVGVCLLLVLLTRRTTFTDVDVAAMVAAAIVGHVGVIWDELRKAGVIRSLG